MGDVLIGRAEVVAAAHDPSSAVPVVRAATDVLHSVVERSVSDVSGELLVLRRVALRFALRFGPDADLRSTVRRALLRALRAQVEGARRAARSSTEPDGTITEELAWFPSDAAATAAYLRSLVDRSVPAWPFRLQAKLGSTWEEVLLASLERGRVYVGDVLAGISGWAQPPVLLEQVSAELALRLVDAFCEPLPRHVAPPEVFLRVRNTVRPIVRGPRDPVPHRGPRDPVPDWLARLVVLMCVLREWPPLREAGLDAQQLEELLEQLETPERQPEADAPAASICGGLVLWAAFLQHLGFFREFAALYPDPQASGAVRWALARALEDPAADVRDPLLLLWSNESRGARLSPGLVLDRTDPAPLHRGATELARAHGLLSEPLLIAPFGEGTVAFRGRVLLDWRLTTPPDRSLPELVHALVPETHRSGLEVRVLDRIPGVQLDVLNDVDVPALPDAWRPAVASLASVLFELARLQLGIDGRRIRRWPALVDEDAIRLHRKDAEPLRRMSSMIMDAVVLGERRFRVIFE